MEGIKESAAGGTALRRVQAALLFAHYLIAFINTTTLNSLRLHPAKPYITLIVDLCILLTSLAVTLRALVKSRNASSGGALALAALRLALIAGTAVAFYFNNRSLEPWLLAVLAATCIEQDERRLFKTGFALGAGIVALMFALSMLGLVENNRGTGFGFIYRTHYACHLLCLALLGCLLKDGKLSWRGELALAALLPLNLLFIHGKTLTCCLLLLLPATFLRHYRRAGATPFQDRARYGHVVPAVFRLLYLPVALLDRVSRRLFPRFPGRRFFRATVWSFALCAALIVALSAGYRSLMPLADRLPGLATVKQRLMLGMIGFEQFPIRLLGNDIPQLGLSAGEHNVELYYAIDSGYVKLLLEYGLLPFLAILGLMTWAQLRLYRQGRYYAMILLAIFAVDGLMEYWIISLGYNLFILLASCRLQTPQTWAEYAAEQRSRPALSPARHLRREVAFAACTALVCLGCATAYPLSTWSGWTPVTNATLVVPGGFIDGMSTEGTRTARLEAALAYLEDHDDAQCILSGNESETRAMAEWLAARGVDPARLSVDANAATVDDMLETAQARILQSGLPPRLTVCAFKMQQARIAKCAEAKHIPVNALTADMPWQAYLPNYFAEQWKVLR